MNPITGISEFWTDSIEESSLVTRVISFHMRVTRQDGAVEWHYYGTPVPLGVTAIEHPAIQFPLDIFNLTDQQLLYSLALEAAVNVLNQGNV